MEISFHKVKAVDVSEIFSLKTPEGGVFYTRTIEIVAVEGEKLLITMFSNDGYSLLVSDPTLKQMEPKAA